MRLSSWPRLLLVLAAVSAGCAKGSASAPDARFREARASDGHLEEDGAWLDRGADLAPDRAASDLSVERGRDLPGDSEQPPDQKAVAEGTCGCGAGLVCVDGGCRCDPATCAGCCTADGKACQTGQDNAQCGLGGTTCTVCSTTNPCQTASCATGTCLIGPNPVAAYPCPGAFGTLCGGGTGVACFSGLTCVTFTAGAKGFCSKSCPSSGWPCSGAPAGTSAQCALSGGSQWYCGFVCSPGTCPTGLSCDYGEGLCKP